LGLARQLALNERYTDRFIDDHRRYLSRSSLYLLTSEMEIFRSLMLCFTADHDSNDSNIVYFEATRPSEFRLVANPLGFTFPPSQVVVQAPMQENEKLFERKARLLTEIAAIEQSISLCDFLDAARSQPQ
jgi:hypothetical protein